jgi:hypothetical protein
VPAIVPNTNLYDDFLSVLCARYPAKSAIQMATAEIIVHCNQQNRERGFSIYCPRFLSAADLRAFLVAYAAADVLQRYTVGIRAEVHDANLAPNPEAYVQSL